MSAWLHHKSFAIPTALSVHAQNAAIAHAAAVSAVSAM